MIKARDINEAWFLNLRHLMDYGYKTKIDRGSYEGVHWRLQLPWICGEIAQGVNFVPDVPQGVPCPTSVDYVESYFRDKLLGGCKEGNEEYTYGERIMRQLEDVIEMLRKTPQTNQTVIEVGQPEDVKLSDPPCLRVISFKVVDGRLNLSSFWRSWDAWAGFPSNIGGLALLQEFMCGFLECVEIGKMFYASDGLHVYDYQLEFLRGVV